jgi:peptidoglycan L-alanyl-D-glutamate endopeptidase CwlK
MTNLIDKLKDHPNADSLTVDRIAQVHPFLRESVYCIYLEICDKVASKYVRVRFSDILRTFKQQNELYKQGRNGDKRPVVTWVTGGYSFHNYGLAIDIVLIRDNDKNGTFEEASWDTLFDGDLDGIADWAEVAKIFEKYEWQWGLINSKGKRYDLPHFQRSFGYKTSQLKRLPKDSNGYPILP